MLRRTATVERLRSDWNGQKRVFNSAMREGGFVTGSFWMTDIFPRHFGPQASRLYQYVPRSIRYLIGKAFKRNEISKARGLRRKAGNDLNQRVNDTAPFELSGTLKRLAMSTSRIRSRATSSRVSMSVSLPTGHPISGHVSGELTRILNDESDRMRVVWFHHTENRLDQARTRKTDRVRPR